MVLTHNHALFHTYLFCLCCRVGGSGLSRQPKHMRALLFLALTRRVNKGHGQKERKKERKKERRTVTASMCNN